MKNKIVFPIVVMVIMSLACQLSGRPSANDNNSPTQTQDAISQPTAASASNEAQSTPSLDSSSAEIYNVDMVLVPEGEFIMGSEDDGLVQTINLDAYYIDKYEVTNISYKTCVDANVCKQPAPIASGQPPSNYGNPDFGNHPVVYVNWYMAKNFCEWRGARLPTEAEWEKAARGTEGLMYPWGNEFDGNSVNFCDKNCLFDWANKEYDDGYLDTAPVGNYERGKSSYGVYDMSGNVWEWVSSLYESYPYDASDGRENLDSPGDRVVRGGGWDSAWTEYDDFLRAAFRNRGGANSAFHNYGFRCADTP